MATTTRTSISTLSLETTASTADYLDPIWSQTYINYYKDADQPPPDSETSGLSEHQLRMARRSDHSPHIAPSLVHIRNIRGHETEFYMEKQGFTIGHLDSRMKHWREGDELQRIYFPEVTELLKRETAAKYVFQYEWHVRSATLEEALQSDSKGAVDINGPVRRAHIDESPLSANNEYKHYIRPQDPGNEHLQGRQFGIYNVWKPLKPVLRDPLCLCDVRTLHDEDLQLGKVQVPNVGEIENFAIRPPKGGREHGWFYLRGQQPDEALVFRIYDSRIDGFMEKKRSHGVAHTSFVDPGTEHESPRESVEVRSFCVF